MNSAPKKWLASVLGLLSPIVSMLYVAQLNWAVIYFVVGSGLTVGGMLLAGHRPFIAILLIYSVNIVCAIHAYILAGKYPADRLRPAYSRWYGLLATFICLLGGTLLFRSFLFEPYRFPSASMKPTIQPGAVAVVQKWGYGHYGTYGLLLHQKEITAGMRRGDLIIFKWPLNNSIVFASRLIGLPGDKVSYIDKRLIVNGKEVPARDLGNIVDVGVGGVLESGLQLEENLDGQKYSVLINKTAPNFIEQARRPFPQMQQCSYDESGVTCEVPAGNYFVLGDNRDNSNDSRYWGFVPADYVIGKVLYILN